MSCPETRGAKLLDHRFLMRRTFVVMLVIVLARFAALSQPSNLLDPWRWVEFTTESGLPSNQILQVSEGPDGTVWVATPNGLAWFDGFRWHPIDSSMGIPYADLYFISGVVDTQLLVRAGDFYIGDRHGFRRINGEGIHSAVPFGDKSLMVVRSGSIHLYEDGTLAPLPQSQRELEGKAISLLRTESGSIFGSFVGGLYRWTEKGWIRKMGSGVNFFGRNILVENKKGNGIASVQFPFDKRGLWEWSSNREARRNNAERADNVKAMDIAPNGEALMVYQSDEIRVRVGKVWQRLTLQQSRVRDILVVKFRSNGDLWLGTEHGLYLCKRSSSRWTYWNHEAPDFRNSINEIFQATDGTIWLGTSDGVDIRRRNGGMEHIRAIDGVPLYVVTGISEDDDGNIWISSGSAFGGAYRWDGRRWQHFEITADTNGVRIHKIRRDRHGRLWFLSLSSHQTTVGPWNSGAFVYTDGRFVPWGTADGLLNGRVYSFAEGFDGTLWFGTLMGLSRWKPASSGNAFVRGVWTHWTTQQGLRTNRVFTIAIDSAQTVWIGDYSRTGLGFVDANDSIRYLTTKDGLLNDQIWDLKVDARGILWITTGGGLASYSKGTFSSYDDKSGLINRSLWPVLPLEHQVYVGTAGRGVAILERSESVSPTPLIDLENPIIEGNSVLLRWKAISYWGEITPENIFTRYRLNDGIWSGWEQKREATLAGLTPGEYGFQVEAKGLFGNFDSVGTSGSFTVPLPLHLRPLFVIPLSLLTAVILALTVILVVRKRNHGLALRRSEEKFRTVAETTSSAILLYHDMHIKFVNAGVALLTEYSEAELLGMTLLQCIHPDHQELVAEKELARKGTTSVPQRYECKILTKSGRERWIDFSSSWIKFQGIPVRLGTATDITERKQAEEKLRSLASELSLTEERERRRMASYLHDVIGQTLALCKIKVRGLQKSSAVGDNESSLRDLRDLIEQSIHNTQSLTFELCPPILYELSFEAAIEWLAERTQGQSTLTIRVEHDKEKKPISDDMRIILFQAVREMLMNIIKHAQATKVAISLARLRETYVITIQDDGIGFDTSNRDSGVTTGGGFGLFNVRERLRHLGGHLEISTPESGGTCVTLVAPLALEVTTHRVSSTTT